MEPSMSSSDISTISKKMESMSMTTQRVIRSNKRIPLPRYSPYASGTTSTKEKQKQEAIRLGVELSLFVAEVMFILSDDIRSMLHFCLWLLKNSSGKADCNGPVVRRLFCVMEYVFVTYIKPKNGVYKDGGKSIQWEQFKTSPKHFLFGIKVLDRIVLLLKKGESNLVKPSGFEYYNQEMKKLEEKLTSFKDISEANGFAKESMKSGFLHLWNSLFETTTQVINPDIILFEQLEHEAKKLGEIFRPDGFVVRNVSEADGFVVRETIETIRHLWKSLSETTPQVINPKIRMLELFRPLLDELRRSACVGQLASLNI